MWRRRAREMGGGDEDGDEDGDGDGDGDSDDWLLRMQLRLVLLLGFRAWQQWSRAEPRAKVTLAGECWAGLGCCSDLVQREIACTQGGWLLKVEKGEEGGPL